MNATRHFAAAAGLALVLAACGGGGSNSATTTAPPGTDTTGPGGDTTGSPTTPAPEDSAQTLLRIDQVGGFAPIELIVTFGPDYVLTTNGMLYSRGAVPAIFPGPLVTPYFGNDASDALADIMDIVDEIGLPEIDEEINDQEGSNIADATTTIATFYDDAGAHRYGVYALGFEEPSDPQAVALQDLVLTLQAAAAAPGEVVELVPERWQVILSDPTPVEEGFEDVRPWPLDVAPDDFTEVSFTMPCIVLEGADADAATAVFNDATQVTNWELEGAEYRLLPRPLFPGEEGCQTE